MTHFAIFGESPVSFGGDLRPKKYKSNSFYPEENMKRVIILALVLALTAVMAMALLTNQTWASETRLLADQSVISLLL